LQAENAEGHQQSGQHAGAVTPPVYEGGQRSRDHQQQGRHEEGTEQCHRRSQQKVVHPLAYAGAPGGCRGIAGHEFHLLWFCRYFSREEKSPYHSSISCPSSTLALTTCSIFASRRG